MERRQGHWKWQRAVVVSALGMTMWSPLAARGASGTEVTVDFTNLGTFTTASLVAGNVTVAGSADVNVLNGNGLGIVGGIFDDTLDGDEFMGFSFNFGCFSEITYSVSSAGNQNGNGTVGDASVEAFGCNDASLGVVAVNDSGDHDLAALFGGQRISRFRVTADDDNQRISSLKYVLLVLDVDGDGEVEPLTDLLLLLRYGFGFRGAVLIASAVDVVNCSRCDAAAIESYIGTLQ